MRIERFIYPWLAIQSYLVVDEETKKCAVIDPPRLIEPIVKFICEHGWVLKSILETHVHADFISGAQELKAAFDDKPLIYASKAGGEEWLPAYANVPVLEGDRVSVGNLELTAMHTPGHTPEHVTWLCKTIEKQSPDAAFTGDFLFVGGVGRPDLLGKQIEEQLLKDLYHSLFVTLSTLPDDLEVFPSHGAGSLCGKSIGGKSSSFLAEERKANPIFQEKEWLRWSSMVSEDMPAAPSLFLKNKGRNKKGMPLLRTLPKSEKIHSREELESCLERALVIDFRDPISFASEHLKGAINIPLSPNVGNWLATVLTSEQPILCVLENENVAKEVEGLIRLLGNDVLLFFMRWGALDVRTLAASLPLFNALELKEALKSSEELLLIDVRSPAEWKGGHLSQALHIELNDLEKKHSSIPFNKHLVAICGSGWRSSIAASFFKSKGYQRVSHVWGGMQAWRKNFGEDDK